MSSSHAEFPTAHAARYLRQMCTYFGQEVPVTFTPTHGHIALPMGGCALRATSNGLTLDATCAASDPTRFERLIEDHLARFAFRERPSLTWHRRS